MFQALASFNWAGLILLILLWMFIVTLALWALDRLFPRIERSSDDLGDVAGSPSASPVAGALPALPRGRGGDPSRQQVPSRQAAAPVRQYAGRDILFAAQPTPTWLVTYWNASRKLIGVLALAWFLSFVVPTVFAPILNQIRVLTGFPLGYYLLAQGSLVIFIALSCIYLWHMTRLDRRFRLNLPPLRPEERRYRRKLLHFSGGFILAVLLCLVILSICEVRFGLPASVINWTVLLLTLGCYAVIGLRSRAGTLDDYYVAGRRIPGVFNGLAIGSEWISGAAFISIAGTLWLLGFEGLAYIIGWAGGFVLLVVFLAPYLRKSGRYTIADFIGARYEGTLARIAAAVICIAISFVYMTAQLVGIGIILNYFLNVSYAVGVSIGLVAVLLCAFAGGMKSVTWTQVVQGCVLVIAYLIPVTWLAFKFTHIPLPTLMYGEALRNIELLEAAQGSVPSYTEPFNDWTPWNFIALVLCLMLGTASMPHILIRFYTVPTVRESRGSAVWALVFICLIYFVVPAYTAFTRWEVLQNVVGQPVTEVPAWVAHWSRTDLLTIDDTSPQGDNGDGVVQFAEMQINEDLVMLVSPEIAGLPATVGALIAAGGLAASLSTASGLLLVMSSSAVHDIYYRSINPRALPRERLFLVRVMVVVVATLVAMTAVPRMAIIAQMVAWAFSLAAAAFFPVLVLGIFWKRTSSAGAIAGMMSGMAVTASYMVLNYVYPDVSILGISHNAAGIFGVPVNFLVMWGVSCLSPPPSSRIQVMVDDLRHP